MASGSPVSGKKIVFWLFGSAIALWAVLLFTGLREKRQRLEASGQPRIQSADTAATRPGNR